MQVLEDEEQRLASRQRPEEVPHRQEGLILDLLGAGVLQPLVPVSVQAGGEQVAQQRSHLLQPLHGQLAAGQELSQRCGQARGPAPAAVAFGA